MEIKEDLEDKRYEIRKVSIGWFNCNFGIWRNSLRQQHSKRHIINDGIISNSRISRRIIGCSRYFRGQCICRRSTESFDRYPTSYINEQGEPAGYDIDVIKKIDELLPEYEFEYEAVSQEALLTGLDTGKYKAAVAGFYSNDDRRAKYLFPEECIGGNIIGLAVRKSDEADIKTLEDVATNKKSVVPIAPTSGMYGIVVEYNNEHPDNQIDLVDTEWTNAADEYKWVADGRYDVAVASKNVVDDTLPKIGLEDQIQFNSFTAIKTWSLFNPKETELAAAYDKALKQLKDDGFISEKSKEYFGEDILPYITDTEE